MRLPLCELSSSKVTTRTLLWVFAQVAYAPRLFFTQVSPVATEQSCMSLHRFGVTKDTPGSVEKSVGNWVNVFAEDSGTLENPNQGLCFWAYLPLVQTV